MKNLHSIGEVAAQTGRTVDTLRVWERRYGRPIPIRLPSGHRRFTSEQLHWLRRVSEALHLGQRPGQAVRADAAELDAWIARASGSGGEDPRLDTWLADARALSAADLRAAFAASLEPESPAGFLDRHLVPFLVRVGQAWAEGALGVRHEHLVSEVATEFLREVGAARAAPLADPPVVLATLAGERHALGIRMAAFLCQIHGVRPFVLGSDVPDEEIRLAARELGARAVVLSISLANAGRETERRLASLASQLPAEVDLVVGGRGLRSQWRERRGITGLRSYAELERWLRDFRARRQPAVPSTDDPEPRRSGGSSRPALRG